MKRLLIVLMLIAPLVLMGAYGQRRNPSTYLTLRTVVATETTQLTAATQQVTPVRSEDGTIAVFDLPVGAMHIRFKGTAAADKTLAWTLWAFKNSSSPAKFVANGTATTGLTQTGGSNEFYCDTIAITAQAWYKTVAVATGAPDAIVSGGGISELVFDTCEHTHFKVVIRDIGGGGGEAATAGADYCTFF